MNDQVTNTTEYEVTPYIRNIGVEYARAANLSDVTVAKYESGKNDSTNVMQFLARVEYETTYRHMALRADASANHTAVLTSVTANHESELATLKAQHQATVDAMAEREKELAKKIEALENSVKWFENNMNTLRETMESFRRSTTTVSTSILARLDGSMFGLRRAVRDLLNRLPD